jgi:tetratricopeptide (TPR) repeat protein
MDALIKVFIEWANQAKQWPLILLAAIPPSFVFSKLYFDLSFSGAVNHWSFIASCGVICGVVGLLYYPIICRAWPRLCVTGPLLILSILLITTAFKPEPEPPPGAFVVAITEFVPIPLDAKGEAATIREDIKDAMEARRNKGAAIYPRKIPITIDDAIMEDGKRKASNLGESEKVKAKYVLWGKVKKGSGELNPVLYLTAVSKWSKVPVNDSALKDFIPPTLPVGGVSSMNNRERAKIIADLVTFLCGLSDYDAGKWDEAIKNLDTLDTPSAYLYGGLCRYNLAQRQEDPAQYIDEAMELYKKVVLKWHSKKNEEQNKVVPELDSQEDEEKVVVWAAYFNLANAHLFLGRRREGHEAIDHLRAAVAAYEAAAGKYQDTATRLPWVLEINRGVALFELGRRTGAVDLQRAKDELEVALSICDEELKLREDNPEQVKANRALTQIYIGAVMAELAQRLKGGKKSEWLERAKAQLEEGLRFYDIEAYPEQKRMALINFANVQADIGSEKPCDQGKVLLRNSIESYRKVLEECDRKKSPELYATTQYNLGCTLRDLSNCLQDGEKETKLKEARDAYDAVIEVCGQKMYPELMAMAKRDRAQAHR